MGSIYCENNTQPVSRFEKSFSGSISFFCTIIGVEEDVYILFKIENKNIIECNKKRSKYIAYINKYIYIRIIFTLNISCMKHLTLIFVLLCIFACSSEDIVTAPEVPVEPTKELTERTINLLDSLEIMDYIYNIIDSATTTRTSVGPRFNDGWDYKLTAEQRTLIANTYPRPLFTTEKHLLNQYFPLVDFHTAVVYGPSTGNYNCFAYSLGVTSRWIEFVSWHDLDERYRYASSKCSSPYDYFQYESGSVSGAKMAVIWGLASPLHASAKWDKTDPTSFSKMGKMWLLHHVNEALRNDGIYGIPQENYFPHRAGSARNVANARSLEDITKVSQDDITLSQEELAMIAKKSKVCREGSRFESLFNDWKEAWNWSLSNNTATTRKLPQYAELKAMGKEIIPLLIEKMATDEDNFFAIRLYEDLQDNPNLIIRYSNDDPRILEGLQQTTKKTIKKWLEYNSN